MKKPKVAFVTKTWGGDYQKMLAGGLERKYASCKYPFDAKYIVVNNGVPHGAFHSMEWEAIYAEARRPMIGNDTGVWEPNIYAVGELAAISAMPWKYDYICYIQGDAIIDPAYNWIAPGIKILEKNPDVAIVSPSSVVNTWHDPKTKLDHYCSDQAMLFRRAEFASREPYKYQGVDPDYPDYGGDSFEAMVGRYLKATGRFRYILEEAYVAHPAY